jgi:hypothetical protein
MNDWPEREPTLADKLMGWAFSLLIVFTAVYFMAHFLVSQGVACP